MTCQHDSLTLGGIHLADLAAMCRRSADLRAIELDRIIERCAAAHDPRYRDRLVIVDNAGRIGVASILQQPTMMFGGFG